MVVYWDLAGLWNLVLDYLLLLGTARLAGIPFKRRRLVMAALLGAGFSVWSLIRQPPALLIAAAMLAICRAAYGKTGRWLKLTLLFALLSCALGGMILLLGRCFGGVEQLTRGVVCADLPWDVFLVSGCLTYLLLGLVFRGGAKRGEDAYVSARIEHGGSNVTLRLLRDTGNLLTDPLTGEAVPIINRSALDAILPPEGSTGTLRIQTVSDAEGSLPVFRCDRLIVDGKDLGARLIAVSAQPVGDGFQGLWHGEKEEEDRRELEAMLGTAS